MKYFKVYFGQGKDREVLYAKASDMVHIELWTLRNRPMADFYGMNIIQVDKDTKESYPGADFCMMAVADYYRYCFPDKSDEEIRQAMIKQVVDSYKVRRGIKA